jgi:hypothetical protein
MKIGVCGSIERAPIIKSLGFDYVEENLSKIAGLSEEDLKEVLKSTVPPKTVDINVKAFEEGYKHN